VTDAILSLGSNLGDREATIRAAVRDIARVAEITAVSSLVETAALKPTGVDAAAPAYLNAVVAVRTHREPLDLLRELLAIEAAHGRVRDIRWGDRTLDIDIVAFGEVISDAAELTIPHPRAAERAFVLAPWLELDPEAVLPGFGRVDTLLAASGDTVTPYPAEPLT